MSRARRWPWALVAILIGLVACGPGRPPPRIYFEDFETACDGAPCGWERSGGNAEQATWVETIHPGEHALRLSGVVTVRGPGAGPMTNTARGDNVTGELVARCEAGSGLQIDVLLADPLEGLVVATDATVAPGEEWQRVFLDFTVPTALSDATVSAIVITKSGSGVCELGELWIDDPELFWGEGTC